MGSPTRVDSSVHLPVLLQEVLTAADVQPGQTWVDGTAGGGGHCAAILERLGPNGKLLAIDRDRAACDRLREKFAGDSRVDVIATSYDLLSELLPVRGIQGVDGILLDLGLSSDQLADRSRGFSFQGDGELDMRFDTQSGEPLWQWLSYVPEEVLADAIYQYGEERMSRRIAKRIVEQRAKGAIKTTKQLADIVHSAIPGGNHGRIDSATKTFQALRIQINDELGIVQEALNRLPDTLNVGGKLLIISFHSLEDRLVKNAYRDDARLNLVTRKPIVATEKESLSNPRSRSAKLRVATKAP